MIDRMDPRLLADALVRGARAELDLTPKPGLVDRQDSGSHPDLDHARMGRSIDLLPRYYEELITLRTGAGFPTSQARGAGLPPGSTGTPREGSTGIPRTGSVVTPKGASSLPACVDCGRRAEARMIEAIGANAHRGYIFLSGLVLLAVCDLACEDPPDAGASFQGGAGLTQSVAPGRAFLPETASTDAVLPITAVPQEAALRAAIVSLARQFFVDLRSAGGDRPGSRVRDAHGLGGVRTEALRGLPSVIDVGLPAYRAVRSSTALGTMTEGSPGTNGLTLQDRAAFRALAALMQVVEDTTAVQRCGLEGLNRIRRDGALLRSVIENERDPRPALAAWNEEYRKMRLTMGGVADCLALVIAFAAME